jgi:predicted O-linked N-acetylglucosamine transferase (SPINDLY family)
MGLFDLFRRSTSPASRAAPAVDDASVLAEQCILRGNADEDAGRLDHALAHYDEALRLAPTLPRAHLNRGNALYASGNLDAAIAAYQTALQHDPGYARAHCNLGNAGLLARRLDLALAAYDAALAADPDLVAAEIGRSNVLDDLGRTDEAIAGYRRALAAAPTSTDALVNLGLLLNRLKRYPEAADCFSRALSIAPGRPYLRGNLFAARIYACDWRNYPRDVDELHAAVAAGRPEATPFIFLIAARTAQAQLRCAEAYVRDKRLLLPDASSPRRAGADRRVRIAYVSADFHSHATAALMAGLFELHDRARFEVFGISFGPDDRSPMRARLQRAFDLFVDVREASDEQITNKIRALGIDIAIDLKGYTAFARPGIFARRAAPIQVNYLGFPGTLGAPYIDYIVADAWVVPATQADCYRERVITLPGSYQVNDAQRRIAPSVPSRGQVGLPQDAFVFCCFNNTYKITPVVFDIWMRLLQQRPGSVLWLLDDNPHAQHNLRAEARSRGVEDRRLVFAARCDLPDHLARHQLADLFLDTLPCNAHTTASDALWAGLPLLTCLGETFAGRVAASLLAATGLEQLITRSLHDYETLALELSQHPDKLLRLREQLRLQAHSSPLFDTALFRQRLERALLQMHQRHLRGEAPAAFAIDA